jgi:hypothetical protein
VLFMSKPAAATSESKVSTRGTKCEMLAYMPDQLENEHAYDQAC